MQRTPARKRRAGSVLSPGECDPGSSPVSDRRVVIYNGVGDALAAASSEHSDDLVCTYQCRQMVKSEFMAAFSTAERQVCEFKDELANLVQKFWVAEGERKKFQDQVISLEEDLAASRGRECALKERILKEVTSSEEQFRAQLMRANELELQLNKEIESQRSTEAIAASAKEAAKELERKLRQSSEAYEREKTALRRELSDSQADSKLIIANLTSELEKTRFRADRFEKDGELMQQQMKDLKEQLNECLRQRNDLEVKLLSSSFSSASHPGTPSEDQKLIKLLQEELRNSENKVQEARRLKHSQDNSALLKENLLEEKRHRDRVEAELSALHEVEKRARESELELASWKELLNEIPGVLSRDDVTRKFTSLQIEVLESMRVVGEVSEKLKNLEVALEFADCRRRDAENELSLTKEKAESSALELKRLELMLTSVTEERDKLRSEMSGHSSDVAVKKMEAAASEKDRIVRELQSNVQEQRKLIDRQHGEIMLLNGKLNTEERKMKSLEREGDRLRSEIALLELKLSQGDYSAANTKVLRMVNTLAVENEARSTIEALQNELKKAQEKLQAVEELKGQSDRGHIDTNISEKLAQLKGQIAVLEKREERYKTVFAEKIQVFRRACCSLFGYKIVMDEQQRSNGIPVTRFTLQSIYAQTDDEKLEFEYESGNTNISINEYTSQPEIARQIDVFVRKMNSIPAFTANLTIELFNRQTLS